MASVALAPLFAVQGRYVQRVALRLPEPPGPRAGCEGVGPELRMLIVGDSAAAGVGSASQDEALRGRLVADLAHTFRVSWALVARTGATTAGTARHLAGRPAEVFDVVVLSLGGNDVMRRRPLPRWLEDVGALAPDGLHPGPLLYQRWSDELARRIRARWASPPAVEPL